MFPYLSPPFLPLYSERKLSFFSKLILQSVCPITSSPGLGYLFTISSQIFLHQTVLLRALSLSQTTSLSHSHMRKTQRPITLIWNRSQHSYLLLITVSIHASASFTPSEPLTQPLTFQKDKFLSFHAHVRFPFKKRLSNSQLFCPMDHSFWVSFSCPCTPQVLGS